MPKFINTQRRDVINSLTDGLLQKLKNPYYLHNDKSAAIVEYFNINTTQTTLDPGSKIAYSNTGDDSPLRFNHIKDFYILLPDSRIATAMEVDDFGLESGDITGEGYILPNTIEPYAGDYFCYSKLDKNYIFKVLETSYDTLDNGANLYRISYKYDRYGYDNIKDLIVKNQRMVINNIGSNFKCIIEDNEYNFVESMEEISSRLRDYYKKLFFKNNVQTFVFSSNMNKFYDPYMIEFLIRNKVLGGSSDYTYVSHAVPVYNTFAIDYDKTFFRALELRDINAFKLPTNASAKYIDNPLSLLTTRPEPYYAVDYSLITTAPMEPINIVDEDLLDHIRNNKLFDQLDLAYRNLIIGFLNGKSAPDVKALEAIDNIVFSDSKTLFYEIPYILYVMDFYITKIFVNN